LLCFARLSTQVLTGSKDGRALLIDTKGSTSAPHQQVAKDVGKEVLSVAWRPGAPTQMAFGTNGGAIFIHDTSKEEGYNAAAPPGRLWPDLSRNSYHGPGAKHEDGTSKQEREDPNIHVSRQHAVSFLLSCCRCFVGWVHMPIFLCGKRSLAKPGLGQTRHGKWIRVTLVGGFGSGSRCLSIPSPGATMVGISPAAPRMVCSQSGTSDPFNLSKTP
jgi:hypothetical protein